MIPAIGALLSPLLATFERIAWVQRHLFPPVAGQLAERLAPCKDALAEPLRVLEEDAWPDDLGFMRERILDTGRGTLELLAAFDEAARTPNDLLGLFRAIRRFARVQELLYPL